MARLFNAGSGVGDEIGVPTVKRVVDGKAAEFVRVPGSYVGGREELVPHKPGNVYASLGEFGFHVIERGKPFDVPHGCPVEAVKALCPHLIDEAEFLSMQPAPEAEPAKQKTKER
jgi:hypothetical protein